MQLYDYRPKNLKKTRTPAVAEVADCTALESFLFGAKSYSQASNITRSACGVRHMSIRMPRNECIVLRRVQLQNVVYKTPIVSMLFETCRPLNFEIFGAASYMVSVGVESCKIMIL